MTGFQKTKEASDKKQLSVSDAKCMLGKKVASKNQESSRIEAYFKEKMADIFQLNI